MEDFLVAETIARTKCSVNSVHFLTFRGQNKDMLRGGTRPKRCDEAEKWQQMLGSYFHNYAADTSNVQFRCSVRTWCLNLPASLNLKAKGSTVTSSEGRSRMRTMLTLFSLVPWSSKNVSTKTFPSIVVKCWVIRPRTHEVPLLTATISPSLSANSFSRGPLSFLILWKSQHKVFGWFVLINIYVPLREL